MSYPYKSTRMYQSKAEYIEFMRATISNLNHAGTYQEEEIDVPISRSYGSQRALAVAIHAIEYILYQSAYVMSAVGEYVHMHLSKKTKADVATPDADADILDHYLWSCNAAAAGSQVMESPVVHHFPKPILVGNNKLFFGAKLVDGAADTADVGIRIHFTPRFVSDSQLMEALID